MSNSNQVLELWVYNKNAEKAQRCFDDNGITVLSRRIGKTACTISGYYGENYFEVTFFKLYTDLSQTKITNLFAEYGFGRKIRHA